MNFNVLDSYGRFEGSYVSDFPSLATAAVSDVRKHVFSDVSISPGHNEDLSITLGIATLIKPGKPVRSLSLRPRIRKEFFHQRIEVEARLRKNIHNPIVDEDVEKWQSPERAREGEYFLTCEMMKELIESKIKGSPHYKVDNLIVLENQEDELTARLKEIHLKEGENILIGYFSGVHAIAGYIQKINGVVKYQIIDSEPTSGHLSLNKCIEVAFPGIEGRFLKEPLQTDYYSCSTFVIKSLMYFAKYGRKLLEREGTYAPAGLLKMAQKVDFSLLDSKTLSEIVSVKKNLTLSEYISQYMYLIEGRNYNTAAFRARYRYFDRLRP